MGKSLAPRVFPCRGASSLDRRGFMGAVGLSALAMAPQPPSAQPAPERWSPGEGPNQPVGEAKGVFPGRVAWVHNPKAANWDGDAKHGGWFEDKFTDPVLAEQMVSESLRLLTGATSDAEAWKVLFHHYNQTHGRGDGGYQAGEKVAVKLNLNCSHRRPDPTHGLYNTPQATKALLRQLVRQARVQETDIVVYDASRLLNDSIFIPCHAEFPGVRFEDRDGGEGRFQAQPDKNAPLYFGDANTPDSGATYLPACATSATYLINAALMKGHSLAGVTLCAKNHFGSVYRENPGPKDAHKGWNPSNMHDAVTVRTRPMGAYNALVDLMGHRHLGGKTILYFLDALYASPHQSVAPEKWQSAPFHGHWTASIFASQDPVAIESVAVDFFAAERTAVKMIGAVDNYLHEAALASQPPSKTRYCPAGDQLVLGSLGVHEHWNNPHKREYSRNLGIGGGIELVSHA